MGLLAAALLTALLGLISLFVGVSDVSLSGLIAGNPTDWLTMVESRLPRMLALVLSGASMAIAGLLTQIVIRNRFVEPSNTGTVESARLGLLTMTLLAQGSPWRARSCFWRSCGGCRCATRCWCR